MAYATAAELRARINKVDTSKDVTVLTPLLSAAERNINLACNRPDGFVALTSATARIYTGSGKSYQWIDECVEITKVEVRETVTDTDYTEWSSSDYIEARGDPKYPDFNTTPYHLLVIDPGGDYSIFTNGQYSYVPGFPPEYDVVRGVPTVRVTAKWGYAVSVPADIKEACLMQAARWFKRFEGSMSDALASENLGMLLFRQSLDPDIKRLLVDGRYVRPSVGRR